MRRRRVLPGFGLSMGYTLLCISLIVLTPLAAILLKTTTLGWRDFWHIVTEPRAMSAYRVSFGASLGAAAVNAAFGLLVAWMLVRYEFFGKRIIDALIDLPFAMPTAVAGLSLATLYSEHGWIGRYLARAGVHVAGTPVGVTVALTFIGLPFVVRMVEPVLHDLSVEAEEAAASLGAARWQTLRRVVFPEVWPAVLAGFTLAFARGLGEYGSVIFISGGKRNYSEIAPDLINESVGEGNYSRATAIAVVVLATSFATLVLLNVLQRLSRRRAVTS